MSENRLQILQVATKVQKIEKSVAENNILLHILLQNQKRLLETERLLPPPTQTDRQPEVGAEPTPETEPHTDPLQESSTQPGTSSGSTSNVPTLVVEEPEQTLTGPPKDELGPLESGPTGTLSQAYFYTSDPSSKSPEDGGSASSPGD